jgi:hypothetical protein
VTSRIKCSCAALAASFVAMAVFGSPVRAQDYPSDSVVVPIVFQAAGPSIASIQSSLDQFRLTIGGANNGNAAGPLVEGRREINWDGGGSAATAPVPTPFTGFQANRGALFTTPGSGFVQAPLAGLPSTFGNLSYETIFQAFSPVRLFSAIGSNVTDVTFFVPGTTSTATTRAFGAVFTDVDQQGGGYGYNPNRRDASTVMEFYGPNGRLLYKAAVPASAGNGSVSFFGALFTDVQIASVRIVAGSMAPGPFDDENVDVVMMDDFVYAEPQAASVTYASPRRR